MPIRILIPFYSMYGHTLTMAQAVREGAQSVTGTEVEMRRIPEFDHVRQKLEDDEACRRHQEALDELGEVTHDDLRWADGIIWGTPTRYGSMTAQMKQVIDSTASLWLNGELENKAAGIFTSTGSIHGGQEATILASLPPLIHLGMIFVGLRYSQNPQLLTTDGIGGSPYGPATVTSGDGSRQPVEQELTTARSLGQRVAEVAARLKGLE